MKTKNQKESIEEDLNKREHKQEWDTDEQTEASTKMIDLQGTTPKPRHIQDNCTGTFQLQLRPRHLETSSSIVFGHETKKQVQQWDSALV